jgi:hypothetical protein
VSGAHRPRALPADGERTIRASRLAHTSQPSHNRQFAEALYQGGVDPADVASGGVDVQKVVSGEHTAVVELLQLHLPPQILRLRRIGGLRGLQGQIIGRKSVRKLKASVGVVVRRRPRQLVPIPRCQRAQSASASQASQSMLHSDTSYTARTRGRAALGLSKVTAAESELPSQSGRPAVNDR